MRSAGVDGAHVYNTLRAKADSLRDQIRTQQLEKAEVRTNKLDIPATALILILLVLMVYPFMAKLVVEPMRVVQPGEPPGARRGHSGGRTEQPHNPLMKGR